MNEAQMLKALGRLPEIPLDNLKNARVDPEELIYLEERKCSHPDKGDHEIASEKDYDRLGRLLGIDSVDDCKRLRQQHKRMIGALGSGSWPSGCHSEYPNHHSVKFYVEKDEFPAHQLRPVTDTEINELISTGVWGDRNYVIDMWAGKRMLDVAIDLMVETYRRVGCAHIEVNDGKDGKEHQIHIKSQYIAGSVIGFAYFNNGSCGDHVNNVLDNSYRPGLHGFTTLLSHEVGHNNNLQHQFTNQNRHHAIMSYSPKYPYVGFATGKAPYNDRPRDPSLTPLARFYGTDPVPPKDPGTPPVEPPVEPPVDPPGVWAPREITMNGYKYTRKDGGGTGGGGTVPGW